MSTSVKLYQKSAPHRASKPLINPWNLSTKNRGKIVFWGYRVLWIQTIPRASGFSSLVLENDSQGFFEVRLTGKKTGNKQVFFFFRVVLLGFLGIRSPFLLMSFLVCCFVIDLSYFGCSVFLWLCFMVFSSFVFIAFVFCSFCCLYSLNSLFF